MKNILFATIIMISVLLDSNVFAQKKLSEAQISALKDDDTEQFSKLFKSPADCNALNEDGATALMLAADSKSPEAVKYLLEHGADLNYAFKSDDLELNGLTAFDAAIAKEDAATIEAFFYGKLTKNMAEKIVCYITKPENIAKCQQLGIDFKDLNCDEEPIILNYLRADDAQMFEALVKAGANVNCKNSYDMPIVFKAEAPVVTIMLKNKVDLTGKYMDKTLYRYKIDEHLMKTMKGRDFEVVEVLIGNGVFPKKIEGQSPTDYVNSRTLENLPAANETLVGDKATLQTRLTKRKDELLTLFKTKGIK